MGRVFLITCMCILAKYNGLAQDVFLPGIVSTDSVDFNACFSLEGNVFYFSRSMAGKLLIYATEEKNGVWSLPRALPFCNDGFSYADPAFSPSGEFYFISNRPTHNADTILDYNVWKSVLKDDHWMQLKNVKELNSDAEEYYISFEANGNAYFSSSRAGGYGQEDLYMAVARGEKFEMPQNLGASVNSRHSEYDPFISANGKVLLFASKGRDDALGGADLYWLEKHGSWGSVAHFDDQINTATRDYCPYISRDGSFYFSSAKQVMKISLKKLPAALLKALNH